MTRRQNLETLEYGELAIKMVYACKENPEKYLSEQTSVSPSIELTYAFDFQYGKDPSGKINRKFWDDYLKQLNDK